MPTFAAAENASVPVRISSVVRVDEHSGRLIRSVRAVRRADVSDTPSPAVPLHAVIDQIADENGVESQLVHSVIRAESNYNPLAISPKGAQGLMQLIPSTAKRFGVQDSFDVRQNVSGGVKYLKFLLDYYQGDYSKTIAAYNAGEEAVDRYNGIPPYAETRNYVIQVAKHLKVARQQQAQIAAAVKVPPAKDAATVNPIVASMGPDGRIYYRTP